MKSAIASLLGDGAVPVEDLWDRVEHRGRRAIGLVRAAREFRGAQLGTRVCATGPIEVHNRGQLAIGSHTTFVGGIVSSRVTVEPGAELRIGDGVVFNYGVTLRAALRVVIGNGCMFGSYSCIDDGDGPSPAPIVLEDDVWLAHGARICPGVRVGAGSVVSAGSVVTQDVPPGSLAIGSPARCMRLEVVAPQREKGGG